MKAWLGDLLVGLVLALLIAMLVDRWPVFTAPLPASSQPPPQQVVMGKYDPIAVYREKDRTLVVMPQAGRDLVVCLGDERDEHCKIVEDWRSR